MSLKYITHTKIRVPIPYPGLYSRQRLLDLLDKLLNRKLILVIAPPGYGKTSALVDWTNYLTIKVSWYSLSEADCNLKHFITHFIVALKINYPNFGKASTHYLENTRDSELNLNFLINTLVNEVYTQISQDFIIILDDYHHLHNHQEINYFVNHFIQNVPDNCHLILTSKTSLVLPDLTLMIARSQADGLGVEELAFQADELQNYILQKYHQSISDKLAHEMIKMSEGWITGLLLPGQTLWPGMVDRLRVARTSGVDLCQYLTEQVLDIQPPLIHDFLLYSSLLEEFNEPLCKTVLASTTLLGEQDWSNLIKTILHNNLFVFSVKDVTTNLFNPSQTIWLRYHHLFRAFLQNQLAQKYPQQRTYILERLATLYIKLKDWERAFTYTQALGQPKAMADLIEQGGSHLIKSGRFSMLASWLNKLPSKLINSNPILLSLQGGVVLMLNDAKQGLHLLSKAQKQLQSLEDKTHLARNLVRQAVAHRFLGNYQDTLNKANAALQLIEFIQPDLQEKLTTNPDKRLHDIYAESLRIMGMGLYYLGKITKAITWLEQSHDVYKMLNQTQNNVAMLLMELGMAYQEIGRYSQTLNNYTQALEYWEQTGNLSQQANLLNNLGVLNHLEGNIKGAITYFDQALLYASQSGFKRAEAFILSSLGDVYIDLDTYETALKAYRQAREIVWQVNNPLLLLHLDRSEARLARMNGEYNLAKQLLASAQEKASQYSSSLEANLCQLEASQLALAQGNVSTAITILTAISQQFAESDYKVIAMQVHFYLAIAYQIAKDESKAFQELETTFYLASKVDSYFPLILAARHHQSLLQRLQAKAPSAHRIMLLLEQIDQFENEKPKIRRFLRQLNLRVPFPEPHLTITTLGKVTIKVNGKQVPGYKWESQTARDLLLCLLAHPDGLTKEEIGNIFWPGKSEQRLKANFKKTRSRLHKALDTEIIIQDDIHYHFNPTLDYEYDFENFERKLTEAEQATNQETQLNAYQAAIRIYRAPYLPGIVGEWISAKRNQLRQNYIYAALQLATLFYKKYEYHATIDYCQRALGEDSCLEEAHRLIMSSHNLLGNRAAVIRQYNTCSQALQTEVKSKPSVQTNDLFEQILNNH